MTHTPEHLQSLLRAPRDADTLPRDTFGFFDDEDAKYSPKVMTGEGSTFKFWDAAYEGSRYIYGEMWRHKTKVGVISAYLIPRGGRRNFHSSCDAISSEVQEAGCLIGSLDGQLREPVLSLLGPARSKAASTGRFLYINEVHVQRKYRGKDFGLKLVKSLAGAFEGQWTLACAFFTAWGYEEQNRPRHDPFDHEAERAKKLKVSRHFARCGFIQIPYSGYWVAEPASLRSDVLPKVTDPTLLLKVWTKPIPTKVDAALAKLDKKLTDCVTDAKKATNCAFSALLATKNMSIKTIQMGGKSIILTHQLYLDLLDEQTVEQEKNAFKMLSVGASMSSLIQEGASVDRARAIHFAVANCKKDFMFPRGDKVLKSVVELLQRLGGKINLPDDDGITPLHLAASMRNVDTVRCLLALGAGPSRSLVSARDQTPLQTLQASRTTLADMSRVFGASAAAANNNEDATLRELLTCPPPAGSPARKRAAADICVTTGGGDRSRMKR